MTAAVATLIMFATAACSERVLPGRDSDGPAGVGSADEESHLCTPGVRSSDVMYTANTVFNKGDRPAAITSVSLLEADGFEIVDALIVPIRRSPADGTWTLMSAPPEWPPPAKAQAGPGVGWSERRNAVGATIPARTEYGPDPDPKMVMLDLVLHLRRANPGSASRFAGLRIEYEIDKREFYNEARTAFTVTNGECPE
ncbi:hypothetical protein ACFVWG_21135 [Kribbella sp. NPDC058245]|uniref:hypothetical protein n=1 Tax=Kribbella sp. NPDC058245 TaxID=3346399 RepID=UPI0036ECEB76